MKGEIPVCNRCCFCVPLRYGLLVWGYFKMTADAFLITLMSYSMMRTIISSRAYPADADHQSQFYEEMIVPVISLAVFLSDFVLTIVFIVGGHKKNVKLIRVFYFLSMVMWILTLLLAATAVVLIMQNLMLHNMVFWERTLLTFSFYFLVLVVQTYFIILLRSEIIKLRNNGEFRFVNNAAEAECTMAGEKGIAGEEIEREDV